MLGQPISMLIPEVVGFKLTGKLPRGRHRHRPRADRHADAAQEGRGRQVRRVLRPRPRFADAGRPRDDRQHGAGIRRDLRLLPGRRRDARLPHDIRPRSRAASRWSRATPRRRACSATRATPDPVFTDTLELDLATVAAVDGRPQAPAGPRRCSTDAKPASPTCMEGEFKKPAAELGKRYKVEGKNFDLGHGDVVIAAITSCTNTSNPSVMIAAGLLARNAAAKRPHGQAVGEDLAGAGLAGRHRISRQGRPAEDARQARLQPRRLRLHHLHRQFRPAAGGDLQDDQRQRPRRRRRALGQPQLRRPRQPRRAGELSRLAAAGRRLCARRLACRSISRRSRSARTRRASRST